MSISRAIWRSRSLLNDEFTGGLPASVIGIGVDIVDTERFAAVIARTPRIVSRLFTESEARTSDAADRSAVSLAARFAAKELPEIFRADDPAGAVELSVNDRQPLIALVTGLPVDVFTASDSFGWVYQFWQAKVLGDTQGLEWHHCEVVTDVLGKPSLRVTGTIAEAARARGISEWHLSLSHDGGHAIAFVVAEGAAHA